MRLPRWLTGLFGKGDGHETKDEDDDSNRNNSSDDVRHRMNAEPIPGPRKNFSVPMQVSVERPVPGPVLVPCNGDGGVQGLRWYAKRLRIDEDGDIADEFLHEVEPAVQDEQKPFPRFQVNTNVRQVKLSHQILTPEGKVQHCVEFQGRTLLV